MTTTPIEAPVLSLQDVGKHFGELQALRDVNLDLRPGQVHALLGANGSGKSTLVKVLSGVYQPDEGKIAIPGLSRTGFATPSAAGEWGVRVVHQEAPLLDTVDVAEAVALFRGYSTRALGAINWKRLRRNVQELLDRMDVPLRATDPCGLVAPADRAGLALAIVVGDLFDDSVAAAPVRLLIVDEVTAAIHESETGRHLKRLRAVADTGVAVVMVTHRLGELVVADDVTVLRGGRVVHREAGTERLSNRELVREMVGVEPHRVPGRSAPAESSEAAGAEALARLWQHSRSDVHADSEASKTAAPVVTVSGLRGGEIQDCSFDAVPGEIVGFAGLRGSGVTDLPRLLSGDLPSTRGEVVIDGTRLAGGGDPRAAIRTGLVALPSDRLRAGGVGNLNIQDNVMLPALRRYWRRNALRDKVVGAVIEAFDVRPPEPDRLFASLSGGNQQKVLLGKWLLLSPSVLVLADPTYGVDPAAREVIFHAVRDAADRGVCVLFFSTEPEQLIRLCARVLVLRDGKVVRQLKGPEMTLENVVEWSER